LTTVDAVSPPSGTPFFYSVETKQRLAKRLGEIYSKHMNNLNLEFTQHAGDEMYHTLYGGLSDDWNPGEPDRLES
jgi:hypothetical protein